MESEALEGQKGLSQERLAFDSEIDRAYVGGLERQTENPTVDLLDRLAATLEARFRVFPETRTGASHQGRSEADERRGSNKIATKADPARCDQLQLIQSIHLGGTAAAWRRCASYTTEEAGA